MFPVQQVTPFDEAEPDGISHPVKWLSKVTGRNQARFGALQAWEPMHLVPPVTRAVSMLILDVGAGRLCG